MRPTIRLASLWILLGCAVAGVAFAQVHANVDHNDALLKSGIAWQDWSQQAFDQAKKENKLVLMHLGAGWCHWCHVMEKETYGSAEVAAYIKDHFIAIHVDQDSRPDLSNRYEDYGWPATIFFDASGKELVKWQGYIPPKKMMSLMTATVADPTPGPSAKTNVTLQPKPAASTIDQLKLLNARLDSKYDSNRGGWGRIQKFLAWDSIEVYLNRAKSGDEEASKRIQQTLAGCDKLIDPVWGGIYQYSTDDDWDHPHFEKIMQFQAEGLRIYSLSYAQFHRESDLKSAKAIVKFMETFLRSPDGAFYTSMDADAIPGEHSGEYFAMDDAGRRKIGLPRIDKHIYARENGWAIKGLLAFHAATDDPHALELAKSSLEWIEKNRAIEGGGFRHDEVDVSGPYLGDSLAMAQAYLAMYEITKDKTDLDRAIRIVDFIDTHFKSRDAGYLTAGSDCVVACVQQFDENVGLVRLSSGVYRAKSESKYKQIANWAIKLVNQTSDDHAAASTILALDAIGNPD